MFVIRHKKIFISISLALMVLAVATMIIRGFNVGIDFTGGSILEVSYEDRPDIEAVKASIADSALAIDARVQPFGDDGVVVRSRDLTEPERLALMSALTIQEAEPTIERFNSIGPTIGKELRTKALIALIVVAIAIILFVAYAFRRVSKPVSSWKYGLAAVAALVHDVLIPTGLFALLGGTVDSLFVVGLLSILGLSVNDTIVVFDRIRENLADHYRGEGGKKKNSFQQLVGTSLYQTIGRSINTSLTLIVVLVALYIVGPESIQGLALVMLFGTIAGTYSSIFFASPLLVVMSERAVTQGGSASAETAV